MTHVIYVNAHPYKGLTPDETKKTGRFGKTSRGQITIEFGRVTIFLPVLAFAYFLARALRFAQEHGIPVPNLTKDETQ